MGKYRVAINGFGRIGRLTFRRLFNDDTCEVVAINCSHPTKEIAHLLKYDSTYRTFEKASEVVALENSIKIGDYEIAITGERDAALCPWKELGIDIVVDCTGVYKNPAKAQAHIDAGAKKVVISAPGDDMPTIVYGVNEGTLKAEDNILCAASCTTNCLAPMAYNLNNLVPIEKGYMTTIHAYTGDQEPLDAFHKKGDLRRARACAYNIVPNTTGAAKAIGKVIPELNGKLDGAAQRVPTPTGSLTELVAVLNGEVTAEQINAYMKEHVTESYAYTEDEIVSTDVIGMEAGSCFDATQTKVMPLGEGKSLAKVVAWYDNEYSYTCQMVRVVKYICQFL
ncbi:MAG: type I glyceraldehyde-3-phosphate dehydrogenase [Lachnospiraceae bacterium]|nr:type I glyceraldehyde-3-phosphate dehydrogenase [Lachnospiraceae bacterium]